MLLLGLRPSKGTACACKPCHAWNAQTLGLWQTKGQRTHASPEGFHACNAQMKKRVWSAKRTETAGSRLLEAALTPVMPEQARGFAPCFSNSYQRYNLSRVLLLHDRGPLHMVPHQP